MGSFRHYPGQRPAARWPAGIGHNAVGAKLFATFLDFHCGPDPASSLAAVDFFKIPGRHYILHQVKRRLTPGCFFDQFDNSLPVAGADNQIHAGDAGHLAGAGLRVTTGNRNDRFRVQPLGPPDHLAGFAITEVGYGASIDQVDVGLCFKTYRLITAVDKKAGDRLRFMLVDFATERINRYPGFWHSDSSQIAQNIHYYSQHRRAGGFGT